MLTEITLEELRPYIAIAFNGDNELLNNLHISPGDLYHCIDHTLSFIKQNADHYKEDIKFYVVKNWYGAPIGYTVVIMNDPKPNELYSFGINIQHRTRENLQEWLSSVEKVLGKPYYIVLWSKNERAIKFFEKNDFLVQRSSKLLNDETKTLIIRKTESLVAPKGGLVNSFKGLGEIYGDHLNAGLNTV